MAGRAKSDFALPGKIRLAVLRTWATGSSLLEAPLLDDFDAHLSFCDFTAFMSENMAYLRHKATGVLTATFRDGQDAGGRLTNKA